MYLPLAVLLLSAPALLLPLLLCIILLRRRRRTLCVAAEDLELASPSPAQKDEIFPLSPRRFTWKEVESATANFTSDVIGKGGFSTVYLAHLPHSITATAKLHHSSERLRHAFRSELDVLLRLRHPHIVRLLGYCDERDDQGVLIFEFTPNGNLHEKLQSSNSLPWSRRTSIAYHVARALDYLHENCEFQIIHGDIKSSNILLDGDFNAKLCDFGCARVGFSAAVRAPAAMMGSPGYVDPNYIRTGLVSKKSDVYSFGVLLLVLITGAEAFDGETERMLTAVAGERVLEAAGGKVRGIVDGSLEGEYDEKEVAVMAGISALCTGENPSLRPSMADVVALMEEKVGSAISTVDCKM